MLATLAEFKAMLGIVDNSQDALLTRSLTLANSVVNAYVGADLSDTSRVRTFARMVDNWRGLIRLPVYPVVAVNGVTMDGVVVDPAGYLLESELGLISELPVSGRRLAVVQYRAGFDPVPDELKMVVMNVAQVIFNNDGTIPVGSAATGGGELKSLTMFDAMSMSFDTGTAGTTVSGAEGLLESWLFLLKRYKLQEPALA